MQCTTHEKLSPQQLKLAFWLRVLNCFMLYYLSQTLVMMHSILMIESYSLVLQLIRYIKIRETPAVCILSFSQQTLTLGCVLQSNNWHFFILTIQMAIVSFWGCSVCLSFLPIYFCERVLATECILDSVFIWLVHF